ncbi:MAG: HAD family hydrolase [Pseudomonadota bacterium]
MSTIRIAMWSGPRNLSTAMMRSFGARADCFVSDEPFYAHYLSVSGVRHPMQEDILAAHETDPAAVIDHLTGPAAGGQALWYQKHMPQHLYQPGVPRDWLGGMRHALLIRDPAYVAASFDAKRSDPTLEDLAVPQLDRLDAELTDLLDAPPPVIEAEDVRRDPEGMLRSLCAALGIDFDPAMLSWPPGRRETDGVWASHWYGAVEQSTGFAPPPGPPPDLPPKLADLAEAARPSFERLRARKLTPHTSA